MKFDRVLVLGTGTLAAHCLKTLLARGVPAGKLALAEVGKSAFTLAGPARVAQQQGVAVLEFPAGREARARFLLEAAMGETLIVSANNRFIIPENVCAQPHITLINSHSALLPKHPGIHAATWAIWEGDAMGGVTWHFIDAGVDSGNIIAQSAIALPPDITALELTRRYGALEADLFGHIIEDILHGRTVGVPQPPADGRRVHTTKDLPNGGMVPLEDGPEAACRLLRSMDYGALERMPKPRVKHAGATYTVTTYRLEPGEGCGVWVEPVLGDNASGATLFIAGGGRRLVLQVDNVSR